MYRFLWRPWWIVSHLAVIALIVTMANLCAWQLRRLDEKQDRNALVEQNVSVAPVSLGELLDELDHSSIDELRYRRVTVTGTYDTSAEVAIHNRTLDGAPGRWVATPLVGSGGEPVPVLVVRGFIPLAVDDVKPPFDGAEPPAGAVTVTGWVQSTQTRGSFGATDDPKGTLTELARVDVARVAQQYGKLAPFWLQLESQEPPSGAALLSAVPLPDLDEGPHLGYALQWAIFTTIAIVGYPLVIRKVARQRLPGDDEVGAGPPEGGPDPDDPTAGITSVVGSAPSP